MIDSTPASRAILEKVFANGHGKLANVYHVQFDLPKAEWLRMMAALRLTWPDERLSDAELARRCMILGIRTLRYLSSESARMFVQTYRDYQPPFDGNGDRRLTTPSEPEPDHP